MIKRESSYNPQPPTVEWYEIKEPLGNRRLESKMIHEPERICFKVLPREEGEYFIVFTTGRCSFDFHGFSFEKFTWKSVSLNNFKAVVEGLNL